MEMETRVTLKIIGIMVVNNDRKVKRNWKSIEGEGVRDGAVVHY